MGLQCARRPPIRAARGPASGELPTWVSPGGFAGRTGSSCRSTPLGAGSARSWTPDRQGLELVLAARPALTRAQEMPRKKVPTSSASSSVASIAGKCPPSVNSLQCPIAFHGSITRRRSGFVSNTAHPVGTLGAMAK